ncbi:hypothetical protein [Simkania sp.]|uniref:hypothetical protein n=1 Tax=Simkania sp. TaxID=34094 RepID=UPI003B51D7C0
MTSLNSISSNHLKETALFGFSGVMLSAFIEGTKKTQDSFIQVFVLGILNQLAFHFTSHLMQGQQQKPSERLAMRLVTFGLNAILFASLIDPNSFLTGCVIGIAHLFFHSYLFPSPSMHSGSSSSMIPPSSSHDQDRNATKSGKVFLLPSPEEITFGSQIKCANEKYGFFQDIKKFIYALMKLIDLNQNMPTMHLIEENCLIVLSHHRENLVRKDGAVLADRSKSVSESDYLVSKVLIPKSDKPLKSLLTDLVKGLEEKNHAFPQKLFIPYTEAGYHAVGLAIEFYDSEIHVIGFDSLGDSSMITKGVKELKSVLETVIPDRDVRTVVTEKSQNNQGACGFHTVFNIIRAANFKGSLYHAVQEANRNGKNTEFFPFYNSAQLQEDLSDCRRFAMKILRKFLENNPGKILVNGKPYDVDLSHDPHSW